MTETIDFSILHEFFGDIAEIRHFTGIFIQQSDDIFASLRNSLEADTTAQWIDAAHKLKGGASVMQAATLIKLCDTAEKMGDAKGADRAAILEKMEESYREIRDSIDTFLRAHA